MTPGIANAHLISLASQRLQTFQFGSILWLR